MTCHYNLNTDTTIVVPSDLNQWRKKIIELFQGKILFQRKRTLKISYYIVLYMFEDIPMSEDRFC